MSLLILHLWGLIKFESADQYQAHACLGLLKNKPQINADERRFIASDSEAIIMTSKNKGFEKYGTADNRRRKQVE